MKKPLGFVAFGLVSMTGGLAQNLWIVDSTPNGQLTHFTSIVDAVQQASDGDTLLVRAGLYLPFVVDGKSLNIVHDGILTAYVSSLVPGTITQILNLQSNQSCVIQGFYFNCLVDVDDHAGRLFLDDCELVKGMAVHGPGPGDVVLSGCSVRDGFDGRESPNVHAYASRFVGAPGSPSHFLDPTCLVFPAGTGSLGVRSGSYRSLFAGCTIVGGEGGRGADPIPSRGCPCSDGARGGPGIDTSNVTSTYVVDCQIAGGAGGPGGTGCVPGTPGPGFVGSPVTNLPGRVATMTTSSPVGPLGTLGMTVTDQPGHGTFFLASTQLAPVLITPLNGVLLSPPNSILLYLGVTGSAGTHTLFVPIPALTVPALMLYLQPLSVDSTLTGVLGQPAAVLLY